MGDWLRGTRLGSANRGLFTLTLAAVLGCRDENVSPTPEGELALTIATTGLAPDANGYRLLVDSAFVANVGTSTERVIPLPAGRHTIQLDDLAPNCQVGGDNPLVAFVTADLRTTLTLSVDCPLGGNLVVHTETVGSSLDPDGYVVALNGEDRGRIGIEDQLLLADVRPGAYAVELRSIAPNCAVSGGNAQSVRVGESQLSAIQFRVACLPIVPLDQGEKLIIASRGPAPGAKSHLYLIATDGSERRQLTNELADDFQPSVSPDGSLIAFSRSDGRGTNLMVYDLALQRETRLRANASGQVAWSPDGARLVYQRPNGGLSIVNADGTGVVAVTSDGGGPYWAPDGREIAFTRCAGLCAAYAITPDGSDLRRLGPGDGRNRAAGPWSPDGTRILTVSYLVDCSYYYYYCNFSDYELSTVNVSTGEHRSLTNTPDLQESSPVWASDGDRIFFIANGDVFVLRLSGGQPTNLTNSPDWEDWVSFGPPPPSRGAASSWQAAASRTRGRP